MVDKILYRTISAIFVGSFRISYESYVQYLQIHYVHMIMYFFEFGAKNFPESNIQQQGHVDARHIELITGDLQFPAPRTQPG